MGEIKMAQKEMEQSKDSKEMCQMKIENSIVRLEKYQKCKTVCVQVTSCPYKAVLQNIPKVSSKIYRIQYLKAPKPEWMGFARIVSRVPIQTIQLIRFKKIMPKPLSLLPPTNPIILVDLPSDDEFSNVEFDISVTNH